MITIGLIYRFAYPEAFTTLPEYSAHRGQYVTVLRLADPAADQVDPESMPVYIIRANDGWIGHADECELESIVGASK